MPNDPQRKPRIDTNKHEKHTKLEWEWIVL
jgi:hypothetical protein